MELLIDLILYAFVLVALFFPQRIPGIKKIIKAADLDKKVAEQAVLIIEETRDDNYTLFKKMQKSNFYELAELFNESVEESRDFYHEHLAEARGL